MKRIILTALVGVFAVLAVDAQVIPERKDDGYKPHARQKNHHRRDMSSLNLTDAQKAQFKNLNDEHRKQLEDLKKQDNITVKESRERMEKIRSEHKSKIESILTPEQKAQAAKDREDRKQKMQEMASKRAEKMKAELGLSDDQATKMLNNRKEAGEKLKAIREDKSLNDDQRREKAKEIMKQQKDNLKSILTAEQLEKMKSKKHDRSDKKGPKGDIKKKEEVKKSI